MSWRRKGSATLLAAVVIWSAAATALDAPTGYRMEAYRAPVPAALPGAQIVANADEARALLENGRALPVFVLRLDRAATPGAPWRRAAPQQVIPGSLWLPNAGLGDPGAEGHAWIKAQLDAFAGADRRRGLMFYCLSDCWLSWNAAKRAIADGWTQVYWWPDGLDGWLRAGLPTAFGEPPPGP